MTKYRKILLAVLAGVSMGALTACETMNRTMVEVKDKASEWRDSLAESDFALPAVDTSAATMKTDQEESIPPVEQVVSSTMPMASLASAEAVPAPMPVESAPAESSEESYRPSGKTIIINSQGATTIDSAVAADKLAPLEQKPVIYTGGAHEQAAAIAPVPAAAAAGMSAPCPDIVLVGELRQFHQFENPAIPKPAEKISSLIMTDSRASCVRNADNIVVDIALDFRGELGPRAIARNTAPSFSYPYFIAVTTPEGNIISKEVFDATMTYTAGQAQLSRTENIHHVIPVNGETYDRTMELMIGFQLSEAELAYNRSLGAATPAASAPAAARKPESRPAEAKAVKTETVYESPAPKAEPAPKPESKPETEVKAAPVPAPEAPAPVAAPAPEAASPAASPAAPGPAPVEASTVAPPPAAAPVQAPAPAENESMKEDAATLEEEIDAMPATEEETAPAPEDAIDITAP